MPKIKEDDRGMYAEFNGWIVRPLPRSNCRVNPTLFAVGDIVKIRHDPRSCDVGIGNEDCWAIYDTILDKHTAKVYRISEKEYDEYIAGNWKLGPYQILFRNPITHKPYIRDTSRSWLDDQFGR